jgi:hypothetical protein
MSDNTNLSATAEAWAKIVIERWEQKILKLQIGQKSKHRDPYCPKKLIDSFEAHVYNETGGDPSRIEFLFNYYGKFLDMGVFGTLASGNNLKLFRTPQPWYSKTFYSELQKLAVIMAEKQGRRAQLMILENIGDNSNWGDRGKYNL